MKCNEIIEILEQLSPKRFACEWDNVGLMAGSADSDIHKILVALDCDDAAVEKAVSIGADLIVTHHPLIFGGLKHVTADDLTGRRIIRMIQNHISCYAMHTNFDVKGGMAQLAADMIGIKNVEPLEIICEGEGLGRIGTWEEILTVGQWAERIKQVFGLPTVCVYGNLENEVSKVAISPGSGKDYVSCSNQKGADLLITGDITHHVGIDAVAQNLAVIDAGHYGIEHIFIQFVGGYLKEKTAASGKIQIIEMDKKLPFIIV